MWKNRSVTALLLLSVFLLGGALTVSADSELIAPGDIKADTVKYSTETVKYGNLTRTQSCSGGEYYPVKNSVLYSGKSGTFVSYIADRNGTVKKGDIIAEIKVDVDEVTIAEKELRLKRTGEETEKGIASREKTIAEKTEALQSSSGTAYQKQAIEIEILKVELERYKYQKDTEMASLTAELKELYADREPCYVVAPIDGELSNTGNYHEGDAVRSGAVICSVVDSSVRMVKTTDSALNYGINVEITSSRTTGTGTLNGKVVMSSDLIPDAAGDFSLIEIENPGDLTARWFFLTVKSNSLEIKNVLLIPNSCRSTDTRSYYATVLGEDNVLHKRKILTFLSSQNESWVIDGLSEGDQVVSE